MKKAAETCATCRFFFATPFIQAGAGDEAARTHTVRGQCLRMPPDASAARGMTQAGWWCGEWKAEAK